MNTMTEEIKDAIRNNLSAEVGEVLKEQLERIPELEKKLKKKEKDLATSAKMIADLQEEQKRLKASIGELEAREIKHDELKVREDALAIREATLAAQVVDAVNYERSVQIQDMKEIFALAFRSPVYRKSTSIPKRGAYGDVFNDTVENVEISEE